MPRNPQTGVAVTQKTAAAAKQSSGQRSPGAAGKTAPGPAARQALPDLKTFTKVINEWKQLVKSAQHQLEILTDLNIGLQKEIAVLVQKEAQARHSAYHDGLTGLPNRSLLLDRFHQARADAQRRRKPLALLLLDLDNFKHVNDRLGHASGDKLLQAVALRLTKGIRGADTACRYGGDEFVIMLPVIHGPAIAATLALEIGKRLGEPYLIDGHRIQMAASIGVAVYPDDGQTFDNLMKQADRALYRGKATGQRTTITEQPLKPAGKSAVFHATAAVKTTRLPERDPYVHDVSVKTGGQRMKH
jgi:diguanylate cyclase